MLGTTAATTARSRLSARLPRERPERMAVFALLALVAGGVALRVAIMVAWRPAFIGFADSGTYIDAARGGLFKDPLRPVGYPLFLRVVHALSAKLSVTILVQHALGVMAALL